MSEQEQPTVLRLEARRFTTITALVREVAALLDHSDYHLEVEALPAVVDALALDLEGRVLMGRLKLVKV